MGNREYKTLSSISKEELFKKQYCIHKDTTFNCEIAIDGEEIDMLSFHNCTFNEHISFRNCKIKRCTSFINTHFYSGISFWNTTFGDSISFNSFIHQSLLVLESCTFKGAFYFIGRFNLISKPQAFTGLTLKNPKELGRIKIETYDFKGKSDGNFSPPQINLDNIDTSHQFELLSSGKIYLNLERSIFKGNVYWKGKLAKLYMDDVTFENKFYSRQLIVKKATRETYSSLKDLLLKSNNNLEALRFYSYEMNAQLLAIIERWPLSIKNIRRKINANEIDMTADFMNRGIYEEDYVNNILSWESIRRIPFLKNDFWVLFFSKYSNKFGSSWSRGVIFTLGVAFIWFSIYNATLYNPIFIWGWKDWDSFTAVIPFYSEFLYAGHKFNFIEENRMNNFSKFVDLVSRIFIGFGYYQTIIAFRKFSNR